MPLPAHRIAHTSRMTHRHPHEHAHDKTPPPRASQRPRRATRDDGRDETTGRRLPAYRHDDEATTPPLADTTTKRPTPRRIAATRPTTRKHGTNDGTRETGSEARRKAGRKKGPPFGKKGGPENGTRYEIKRHAANYSPSLSESSGKRGKSRRRERKYSYCSRLIAISAGIPSVNEVVRVSKRSRISTIRSCVARDGTGISICRTLNMSGCLMPAPR